MINHLVSCQILMSEWQFLPSLLQLHQAHSKLLSWGASAQQREVCVLYTAQNKEDIMYTAQNKEDIMYTAQNKEDIMYTAQNKEDIMYTAHVSVLLKISKISCILLKI